MLARGHETGPSPPVTLTGAERLGLGTKDPHRRALVLSQAQPCLGKVMSRAEPAECLRLHEHLSCRVGKGISTQWLLISSSLPLMPDATVPAIPTQNPQHCNSPLCSGKFTQALPMGTGDWATPNH